MSDDSDALKELIQGFQASIGQHMPALEQEVDALIQSNSTDPSEIENMLDTLMPLVSMGVGNEMFIRLIEYYKRVDQGAAAEYWRYYEEMD